MQIMIWSMDLVQRGFRDMIRYYVFYLINHIIWNTISTNCIKFWSLSFINHLLFSFNICGDWFNCRDILCGFGTKIMKKYFFSNFSYILKLTYKQIVLSLLHAILHISQEKSCPKTYAWKYIMSFLWR